jgi:hypothetical protein
LLTAAENAPRCDHHDASAARHAGEGFLCELEDAMNIHRECPGEILVALFVDRLGDDDAGGANHDVDFREIRNDASNGGAVGHVDDTAFDLESLRLQLAGARLDVRVEVEGNDPVAVTGKPLDGCEPDPLGSARYNGGFSVHSCLSRILVKACAAASSRSPAI